MSASPWIPADGRRHLGRLLRSVAAWRVSLWLIRAASWLRLAAFIFFFWYTFLGDPLNAWFIAACVVVSVLLIVAAAWRVSPWLISVAAVCLWPFATAEDVAAWRVSPWLIREARWLWLAALIAAFWVFSLRLEWLILAVFCFLPFGIIAAAFFAHRQGLRPNEDWRGGFFAALFMAFLVIQLLLFHFGQTGAQFLVLGVTIGVLWLMDGATAAQLLGWVVIGFIVGGLSSIYRAF